MSFASTALKGSLDGVCCQNLSAVSVNTASLIKGGYKQFSEKTKTQQVLLFYLPNKLLSIWSTV